MKVGVAYSTSEKSFWVNIDVEDGCSVAEAIRQSGILQKYPEIDIETNKLGIYGKFVKMDAALKEGDRVEIYRPITCDPETVPRRDTDDDDD